LIAGCKGWEDIEDFGETRIEWLRQYGDFSKGIPTHDTIARVISRLNPEQFQSSFIRWMGEICSPSDNEVIAIDGKTLKGSYNRQDRHSSIHMVSAFATMSGMVLGQQKTREKSNEITAIPELLELLDIKKCIVTIDAMGCQKEIVEAIVDKEAHYLLAVKGNQPTLYKSIQAALRSETAKMDGNNVTLEQHHGRTEVREYHVIDASQLEGDFSAWKGLKTLGVAISYRHIKQQKTALEYRYYISSAELKSEEFAHAVRSHWGIENQLHWVLDVNFQEDACQIHRGDGAENLARMRHVAFNLLKSEQTKKCSLRRKQRFAAMSTDYLERIINA
jgi:predicted transposase YbfD/YdcC